MEIFVVLNKYIEMIHSGVAPHGTLPFPLGLVYTGSKAKANVTSLPEG